MKADKVVYACRSAGTYTFTSSADYDGRIPESNELNNRGGPVGVRCMQNKATTIPRFLPDLISTLGIDGAGAPDANGTYTLSLSQPFTLIETTQNIGSGYASASQTNLSVTLGGAWGGYLFQKPVLPPGAYKRDYVNYSCPNYPNMYYFRSFADYYRTVLESNEGNNAGGPVGLRCIQLNGPGGDENKTIWPPIPTATAIAASGPFSPTGLDWLAGWLDEFFERRWHPAR